MAVYNVPSGYTLIIYRCQNGHRYDLLYPTHLGRRGPLATCSVCNGFLYTVDKYQAGSEIALKQYGSFNPSVEIKQTTPPKAIDHQVCTTCNRFLSKHRRKDYHRWCRFKKRF